MSAPPATWSRTARTVSSTPATSCAPCGTANAGLEALGAVGAAGDDRLGRDEQARAGDDALVDRLLEPDVGEARALGAEVALGGEAGLERSLGLDDGAGGAQRERLVQHLIVPQRLVVGVEEEVRMALDHAGHQGGAGQVDRFARRRARRGSARRRRCGRRRPAPTSLRAGPDPRRRTPARDAAGSARPPPERQA